MRGVAVLAVLLFHGGFPGSGGGFLGVDAFFVLSGYLITTLLLEEHGQSGRIDLGAFWARRARRLLPALAVVVGAVVVVGHASGAFGPGERLRVDALAALGYVANLRFITDAASYFGSTAAPSPLL